MKMCEVEILTVETLLQAIKSTYPNPGKMLQRFQLADVINSGTHSSESSIGSVIDSYERHRGLDVSNPPEYYKRRLFDSILDKINQYLIKDYVFKCDSMASRIVATSEIIKELAEYFHVADEDYIKGKVIELFEKNEKSRA